MDMKALRHRVARVALAYPSLHPITIRKTTALDEGEAGEIDIVEIKGKTWFQVRVADFSKWTREELEQSLAEFVVDHEQAHAIQWRADHQEIERLSDHDEEFGIALARVWRINREKAG